MKKLLLVCLLALGLISGCGSGAPPAITVGVAPSTATVQAGASQQFTATVQNSTNAAVTWTLTQAGTACSPGCGTLSSTTANPVTYTAPANPPASNLTVSVTATSVADTTKSGSATVTVPAITVSVAPAASTVLAGNSQQFTATVQNTSNVGVTWTLSGTGCTGAACGTLSSTTTNPVTYTAPGPPASNLTVIITATSSADTTKSGSATITVPAITVAVAPASANVPVKGTQNFTATVSNDAGNRGVTWVLTQGTPPAPCSPGCGTITAATLSGSPATYTAPATVPANPNVTVTATSVSDATKSATATATVVGITVSVSPTTASVVINATQQFTATVANDVSSSGVTWTLTQGGVACSPTCGTVVPPSTASGTPTTYTAPATVPANPTVTLTATSVADGTKTASATITVTAAPPISVSISPTNPTVTTNTTQQFTATVTNDPANKGVTWTLTQGGTACSPTCGTVSPASTASGAPTTYTAPATVPTPATVTITATSVADTTKSASTTITISAIPPCGTGSEGKLSGQYAFLLQGFDANGPVAIAGSFTANGAGAITAGQEDVNRNIVGGVTNPTITGSTYSVGSDNRGCLTLVAGTTTSSYRFSLGAFAGTPSVATKGHIVSFDTTGTNVVGVFQKQDPTVFSPAAFRDDFAIGAASPKAGGGRFGVAGRFTADGVSTITAAEADTNDNGTPGHFSNFSGTYSVAGSGRGTLTLNPGPGITVRMAFYVVSANEALVMSIDPQTANSLFAGSVLKQSGGPFGIGSLNGTNIVNLEGQSPTAGTSRVEVGFFEPTGNSLFTATLDENDGGTIKTNSPSGTYNVFANGRVTLGPIPAPVLYLVSQNRGFFLGDGTAVETGFFEPQAARPFTNASIAGSYFFGDVSPVVSGTFSTGVATPNGVSPTGAISGTSDSNQSGTLTGGQPFNAPYSVAPTGRVMIGTAPDTNVMYIISTSKAILMSTRTGMANSTVTVVDK